MSIWLEFVRRRTVFVRTVFFEDLLILTVTGFSDLCNAFRKSTHATIRVTSYLVVRELKNPTPLSALWASIQFPYFFMQIYAHVSTECVYWTTGWIYDSNIVCSLGVPRRQPHCRSGLAALPSVTSLTNNSVKLLTVSRRRRRRSLPSATATTTPARLPWRQLPQPTLSCVWRLRCLGWKTSLEPVNSACCQTRSVDGRMLSTVANDVYQAISQLINQLVIHHKNGGTTAAAPPPFRLGDPALCGSHSLVAL